jgi:rhodanese-related sulfurtransferase
MNNIENNMENNMQDIQENLRPENIQDNVNRVEEGFEKAHQREEETLGNAKENFQENVADKFPVPTPTSKVSSHATAHELKSRLNWGEPGLTILDVRDRAAFDDCRILGALSIPVDSLPEAVQEHLQFKRDIYIYGDSVDQAESAAQVLRQAGFYKVSVLAGGLESWKQIEGSVDGTETNQDPSPGAYNVFSRLKEFAEARAREKQMK